MQNKTWAEILWGQHARFLFLFLASLVLLFTFLGSREIWTQEHRWADIVTGMFYRHDFFHPFLGSQDYYDKPLLSYWFIAAIAWVTGNVSTWALRLPSAFAGLLAIWSVYRIGIKLQSKQLGLLSGWILLTTFYFIFWAKTSSADMLNMAGSAFAVAWYLDHKDQSSFFSYSIFFLILALTALCKGLSGVVVPFIVILPFLFIDNEWKKHLNVKFFLSMLPGIIVYLTPFVLSSYFSNTGYHENGLYLVYRENILRYFQPFDHKGPLYTYFVFLPIYLFPWALFFIPAFFAMFKRWSGMSAEIKAMNIAVILLFVFFTLSGSRRNYYILSVVPFAVVMTAEWILAHKNFNLRNRLAGITAISFFIILFAIFDVIQPLYYVNGGAKTFANALIQDATKIRPWSSWNIVMLDPEIKISYYLNLPPDAPYYGLNSKLRSQQTTESLLKSWPFLAESKSSHTIFLTRKVYESSLIKLFPNYEILEAPKSALEKIVHKDDPNALIAFIPVS